MKLNEKSNLSISLSDEKIQRLTEAGFEWERTQNKPRKSFDEHFDALMAYKKEHKHCNVPRVKSSEYYSLGQWCGNLRHSYKQIMQNAKPMLSLSNEKIQRLTEAGFDWRIQPWHDEKL